MTSSRKFYRKFSLCTIKVTLNVCEDDSQIFPKIFSKFQHLINIFKNINKIPALSISFIDIFTKFFFFFHQDFL